MQQIELREIKKMLDEIHRMLEAIYEHFAPAEKLPPGRIYQLKEKARQKALAIRQKEEIK